MSWRKWLGTYTGRQVLQGSAFALSMTAFAGYHLPQSLLLEKYKEVVQAYDKGLGQPVPLKSRQLYEQVLDDLKVPTQERRLLDIFTVYGFDLFHAGSTALRTGAIIGIPISFSYEQGADVNRKIKVVTKSVDWESEIGEQLKASLVLSEDARRFALARELTSAGSAAIWAFSLIPTCCVLGTYMASRTLNERFNLRNHPFRMIMYSLVSAFSFALYCMFTDLTTASIEASSDETAAQINPAYAQGGIEFYTKLRERNKALRELMGEAGPKVYTTSGNEITFIRMKTTPLSERLRGLEDFVAARAKEESDAKLKVQNVSNVSQE